MKLDAFTTVIRTFGLEGAYAAPPYLVVLQANMPTRLTSVPTSFFLLAVVDDFGSLVIVGGPL